MAYQPLKYPLETAPTDVLLDAFSRQRVSQLSSLLNLTQVNDESPLLVDTLTNGTALATYVSASSATTLTTAASGDYVIRQTFQRMPYYAGKSQFCLFTAAGFNGETNVEKRIGYFNGGTAAPYATFDGLFFQSDSTGVSVNIYKGGTMIEQTYQSSWNGDKLDGTGASGITVDFSKNQIYALDFQWLGVGRVRWYLDINGILIKIHESYHANTSLVGVYIKSPNQPIRYEVRQTGLGSGVMSQICSAINSEGSVDSLGINHSVDMGVAHVNAATAGTFYALVGIRLKSTYLDSQIRVVDASVFSPTNTDYLWRIVVNPTITGVFNYTGLSNSAIEYGIGDVAGTNTVTGGYTVAAFYAGSRSADSSVVDSAVRLGASIAGVRTSFVLCATSPSNNADFLGALNWRETI